VTDKNGDYRATKPLFNCNFYRQCKRAYGSKIPTNPAEDIFGQNSTVWLRLERHLDRHLLAKLEMSRQAALQFILRQWHQQGMPSFEALLRASAKRNSTVNLDTPKRKARTAPGLWVDLLSRCYSNSIIT
jgi:hypothetical protein